MTPTQMSWLYSAIAPACAGLLPQEADKHSQLMECFQPTGRTIYNTAKDPFSEVYADLPDMPRTIIFEPLSSLDRMIDQPIFGPTPKVRPQPLTWEELYDLEQKLLAGLNDEEYHGVHSSEHGRSSSDWLQHLDEQIQTGALVDAQIEELEHARPGTPSVPPMSPQTSAESLPVTPRRACKSLPLKEKLSAPADQQQEGSVTKSAATKRSYTKRAPYKSRKYTTRRAQPW
ncbi:hypothetical protein AcV7_007183 [Taiwanofungus camphoratus]|nr:hypothetical protein AcV7_007183 [Antrodia cinnamomea]